MGVGGDRLLGESCMLPSYLLVDVGEVLIPFASLRDLGENSPYRLHGGREIACWGGDVKIHGKLDKTHHAGIGAEYWRLDAALPGLAISIETETGAEHVWLWANAARRGIGVDVVEHIVVVGRGYGSGRNFKVLDIASAAL